MKNAARAIAEQTLRYSCADGREERIHVALYAPRSEEIDWSCRLTVTGFSRKVRRSAWGVDAMQALVLAIHILPLELRSFVEGEPGHFIDEPDLGIDRACRMNLDPEAATNEFVAHYVRQLARAERENAWHRLAEAGGEVVPSLIRALQSETDVNVQTELIRLLAEYRSSEGIPVLADLERCLHDNANCRPPPMEALKEIERSR